MIVTITMNPSIDISYSLPTFNLDTVNRVSEVRKTAGGKGLNVTRVLRQLEGDVLASGLLGGPLGTAIQQELTKNGIKHAFFPIQGQTRNCIAILHEGKQTEILENGPMIRPVEAKEFLAHFAGLVEPASLLVFSGSLPAGLPKDFYREMVALCQAKNKPIILDCSGEALKSVLQGRAKPLLIKPNAEELADLLARPVNEDPMELKKSLQDPLFADVEWIVVSLGAKGAFAKHNDICYQVTIPNISVVNPVGSGDATVAGLAFAIDQGAGDADILKKANVLGMLNAQEEVTGQVNLAHYQELYDRIQVTEI